MTLPIKIEGHDHANSTITAARVTRTGQLVTAPFSYDDSSFQELADDDVALNFYKPKAGKQFVITGVIATGDKQVGANEDATVVIFEGPDALSETQDKILLKFVLTQSTVVSLLPLNIIVNEGKFVQGVTDNDDVHMNIFGYYIPSLTERTDFRQT